LNNLKEELLGRAMRSIEKSLQKGVDKGKLTSEEKEKSPKRIIATTRFEPLRTCDLVIEAVFEELSMKQRVLGELDKLCPDHAILVTNNLLPSCKRDRFCNEEAL
jgi:3-hydroxybutyryl-CoA dehydrogenase